MKKGAKVAVADGSPIFTVSRGAGRAGAAGTAAVGMAAWVAGDAAGAAADGGLFATPLDAQPPSRSVSATASARQRMARPPAPAPPTIRACPVGCGLAAYYREWFGSPLIGGKPHAFAMQAAVLGAAGEHLGSNHAGRLQRFASHDDAHAGGHDCDSRAGGATLTAAGQDRLRVKCDRLRRAVGGEGAWYLREVWAASRRPRAGLRRAGGRPIVGGGGARC